MFGPIQLEFLKIFHQKGWVYVDMKPENIMLGLPGSGKENRSFVVDFGCAMRYRGFDAAEGGQANGTPNYISIFAHNGGSKYRQSLVNVFTKMSFIRYFMFEQKSTPEMTFSH